jgi:hypothetical protein
LPGDRLRKYDLPRDQLHLASGAAPPAAGPGQPDPRPHERIEDRLRPTDRDSDAIHYDGRGADRHAAILPTVQIANRVAQAREEPSRARRLAGTDRHGRRRDAAPDRAGSARRSATAARSTRARTAECGGDGPARAARVAGDRTDDLGHGTTLPIRLPIEELIAPSPAGGPCTAGFIAWQELEDAVHRCRPVSLRS